MHTKLLVVLYITLIHISGCQNITIVLCLWQWESSLYLSPHSDIIILGQSFVILQVKEALEQVFKQPYETILKNRPEFGDAQMTNALSSTSRTQTEARSHWWVQCIVFGYDKVLIENYYYSIHKKKNPYNFDLHSCQGYHQWRRWGKPA